MFHARRRLLLAILVLFGVVSAARLVAIPTHPPFDLARWSTFALMPSLALWVLARRGPALIVAALLCSTAGDILLGYDDLFLAGMGAFALAHICYITFFVRSGALPSVRRRLFVVVCYAVALIGLIAWLWPGLGDLRVPLVGYALLLAGTAVTSSGLGVWTGVGGGLFFASDALIAVGLADRPQPPMPDMWVMATYVLAQFLLASGSMRAATHEDVAEPVAVPGATGG
jgi:uncharacterized membrane protein YhhN